MQEALTIILLVVLIIFVITLIVLCIKLMNTLNKANYLIDNVTKKAETLDGVFNVIDIASNRLSGIGETVMSGVMSLTKKLFRGKKEREEEEDE